MYPEQSIIIINITCMACLILMMTILVAAARRKNGTGTVAMVMVTTTVPVYFSNLIRTLGSEWFLTSAYLAIFCNVLCFPALWFFVRSQYGKPFRFTVRNLLHFIPAVVSLLATCIYYGPLTAAEVEAERAFLESGSENPPAIVNDILLFGQFFIYFFLIFRFIRRSGKYLQEHYADSDFLTLRWIPGFMTLFFVLFFIVFVAYVIDPRTDAWLIPILNTAGMAYLVYHVIYHSATGYANHLEAVSPQEFRPTREAAATPPDPEQMRQVCERITAYLSGSRAYCRHDLSLAMLAAETGLPQKTLSRSINGYLKRNFFELINEMRVEEAKRQLLQLAVSGYTIDSIYETCGFRSRSTFFLAFKKTTGLSPAQWLNAQGQTSPANDIN